MRPHCWMAAALCACSFSGSPERAAPPAAGSTLSVPPSAPPLGSDCSIRISAAEREASWPGAPELERVRVRILATAKAEPVLFVRAPEYTGSSTPEVELRRRELNRSSWPLRALLDLLPSLRSRPEVARAVLLREGYLYAETARLGTALVDLIKLEHLFDEPEVWIQRGSRLLRAQRVGRGYELVNGDARERASLLLFDRVWVSGSEPGPPLHRDVRALQRNLGFDELRVRHIGERAVVAELRYGADWVPSLIAARGAALELDCESLAEGVSERIALARDVNRRLARVLDAEHDAIGAMIDEALPFDEPKTEEGQQDGNLRPAWRWAFEHGWDTYRFNDDTYDVLDAQGRPLVPQVCVDFITDTLERASGTWWGTRGGQLRERVKGRLDFEVLGIENRRSVNNFVDFAWAHPEWFDAYDLSPRERIPFGRRDEFFAHLARHRDRYRVGDVVTVHGLRGEDGLNHYHSMLIYASDPMTGVPIWVAANAGKPRVRTWEAELHNAPKRSLKSRIRPRLEWLEALMVERPVSANEAPEDGAPI